MPQDKISKSPSSARSSMAANTEADTTISTSSPSSVAKSLTEQSEDTRGARNRISLPSIFQDVESMQQVALIVIIALLAIGMQINFPHFLAPVNLQVMTVNFVTEAIMALGMTIVMITAGIDISVAGVLQFCAIVVGMLMNAGLPFPVAIVLTLGVAAILGLINITMAILFKVHPFISSLSMLLLLRGVSLVITEGATVTNFPDAFTFIGQEELVGIPVPLLIFGVLAIVIGYALKNHRFFQQAYFIGGNRRAARMSGVKVERFLVFTYVLSGVLAGIAGIVTAAKYGAASVSFGQNAELRVIASVAIGGASFTGGTGTIFGTTLGVLFLAMIYNAFAMTGVNTYWQDVAIGAMLLTAVFLGEYLKKRQVAR